MAKQLNCGDVGFDCQAQFNADTEEEIMSQAAEHAPPRGVDELHPDEQAGGHEREMLGVVCERVRERVVVREWDVPQAEREHPDREGHARAE